MKHNREFDVLRHADNRTMEELADLCPPGDEKRMEKMFQDALEKSRGDVESETGNSTEISRRPQWTRAAMIAACMVICGTAAAGIGFFSKLTPPEPTAQSGAAATDTTAATAPTDAPSETAVSATAAHTAEAEAVPETTAVQTATDAPENAAAPTTQTEIRTEMQPVQTTAPQEMTTAAETAAPVNAEGVYSSRSGVITLNADGTGTIRLQDTVPIRWDDRMLTGEDFAYSYTVSGDTITVDMDGMERSFTKGGEMPQSDIPLATYIAGTYYGNYPAERAVMYVEASQDDTVKITVRWGSSAMSAVEWTMSGICEEQGDSIVISYQDGMCREVEYHSDGTIASETTQYTQGTGTITFTGTTAEWSTSSEDFEGALVFEYFAE